MAEDKAAPEPSDHHRIAALSHQLVEDLVAMVDRPPNRGEYRAFLKRIDGWITAELDRTGKET